MRLRSASGMHFGYLFLDCTSSQGNWQLLDWSLITQLPFYIHPLSSVACFLSHARPRRNARSVNNYPPGPRAQRRVDILKYLFHLSKEEKNPLLVLPQRDGYTIKCTYTWLSQKKKSSFYEVKWNFPSHPLIRAFFML